MYIGRKTHDPVMPKAIRSRTELRRRHQERVWIVCELLWNTGAQSSHMQVGGNYA